MAPRAVWFIGLSLLSGCVAVDGPSGANLASDATVDASVSSLGADTERPRAAVAGLDDALKCDLAPSPEPAAAHDEAPGHAPCPRGMALVAGAYCPVVRHSCKRWLEDPAKLSYARCAEYAPEADCLAPRVELRFCIDLDEYAKPGESVPVVNVSWKAAKRLCEDDGKRLCLETEWQFACEGEELRPYPYGWVRDASLCNFDRVQLILPDGSLRDLRASRGEFPACTSPFGVHDMVGNVDEWTVRDDGYGRPIVQPHRSSLRGGWWMAARNRCRAATTAHDEVYEGPQTGFRCCADAR